MCKKSSIFNVQRSTFTVQRSTFTVQRSPFTVQRSTFFPTNVMKKQLSDIQVIKYDFTKIKDSLIKKIK